MSRFIWWSATFYEKQYHLMDSMPDVVKEWGYQDEICPNTKRPHRQSWLKTKQQTLKALIKKLPGVHLEPIPSTETNRIAKLKEYCAKEESKDPEGKREVKKNPNFLTTSEAFMLIAKHTQGYITIETVKSKTLYKDMYWYGVNRIIADNPALIGYFTPPQMEKVWKETFHTWNYLFVKSINESEVQGPP